MKSFALTLVASLAAAQTYEESYDGSAEVDGVGTTDFSFDFKTEVEETTDLLTTTTSSDLAWQVVLEGDDIVTYDEVEAWFCYENEACVIMRSVGTDNLSVYYTEAAGLSLPNSDCSAADAQPSQALSNGLGIVAVMNGTQYTTFNNDYPELVPDTVSISGKTISMSALTEDKTVIDLAAIREAEEAAEALAAEFEAAAGDFGDLGDLGDILGDLDSELQAQLEAELQAAAAEAAAQLEAEAAEAAEAYADAVAEANKDIKQTTGLWVKRAGGAVTCAQGEETVQSFVGAGVRIAEEKATYESQTAHSEKDNDEDEEAEDEETEDEESSDEESSDEEDEDEEDENDGANALTTIAATAVAVAALAF